MREDTATYTRYAEECRHLAKNMSKDDARKLLEMGEMFVFGSAPADNYFPKPNDCNWSYNIMAPGTVVAQQKSERLCSAVITDRWRDTIVLPPLPYQNKLV